MATGTKAPASKSLDYGLTGDILDRVSDAGETKRPKESTAEVVQDLGEDLYKVGKEKKEFGEMSNLAWDMAFDAQGERGDWVSPELYDQFQQSEGAFKEAYLEAVNSGDKTLAATLLQKQGNRAASLDGWKDIMAVAEEVNSEYGWGNGMTGDPDNMHIMSELSKNDGSAVMRIDDTGSMVFDIKMPPDDKIRSVTKSEIDKIVTKSMKPLEREDAWFKSVDQSEQRGLGGLAFREERNAKANMRAINKDNITSYIDDPFTGYTSFGDDFLESGEFKKIDVNSLPTDAGTPDDASDDLKDIMGEDKDGKPVVVKTLNEQILDYLKTPHGFEMAQVEVAAWMTAKQREKYDGGKASRTEQLAADKKNMG